MSQVIDYAKVYASVPGLKSLEVRFFPDFTTICAISDHGNTNFRFSNEVACDGAFDFTEFLISKISRELFNEKAD